MGHSKELGDYVLSATAQNMVMCHGRSKEFGYAHWVTALICVCAMDHSVYVGRVLNPSEGVGLNIAHNTMYSTYVKERCDLVHFKNFPN
jgi:hypothetical protein